MTSIFPIPSAGRTSDILLHQRLLSQTRTHELRLLKLQEQLSTGRRISRPSEDPQASQRGIQLQRLLENNAQYRSNVTITRSFLAESSTTLQSSLNLIREARGLSVTAVNATTTAAERSAIVTELRQIVNQLVGLGNSTSRGRFLFAGSETGRKPYSFDNGLVVYDGNDQRLRSQIDPATQLTTNITGQEAFGGESIEVRGRVDLNPVLTEFTRLDDLNGGLGVESGSIELYDGSYSSTVDLSQAETIGDVVRLIESNAPFSRSVEVTIQPDRLDISLDTAGGGYLAIREVNERSTARDLGILTEGTPSSLNVVGKDLDPALDLSTGLNEILGVRASAVLTSFGDNNDILIQGATVGSSLNGYSIQYVDDDLIEAAPGLTKGNEQVVYSPTAVAARAALTFSGAGNNLQLTGSVASDVYNQVEIVVVNAGAIGNAATVNYDSTNKVLQIGVDTFGGTQVQTVVNAINADGNFTAAHDASDPADGPYNPAASISPADVGFVRGNTGNSGGNANTVFIHVNRTESDANDVVAAFESNNVISNLFEASLLSGDSGTGHNNGSGRLQTTVAETTSGGSGTALDLDSGIRVQIGTESYQYDLSKAETVEDFINIFNDGPAPVRARINAQLTGIDIVTTASGVNFSVGENGGTTATQLGLRGITAETELSVLNFGRGVETGRGTDFVIRRNDGVELEIDVSNAVTIQDVLDLINGHPLNADPLTRVEARLAVAGNGIELVDDNPPTDATLAVVREATSNAAIDLGFVPVGEVVGYPGDSPPPTPAGLQVRFDPPNHDDTAFELTAVVPGTELNGVQVEIVSTAASGDQALVNYNSITKTLTIDVDPSATTANTLIQAIDAEGTFTAALLEDQDPVNNGQGLIPAVGPVGITSGGSSQPSAQRATATLLFAAPNDVNTAIDIEAALGGTEFNGVEVVFANTLAGDVATATYNAGTKQLVIDLDVAATTANTIVSAINLEGTFTAVLDTDSDPTNDGTGIPTTSGSIATTDGGTAEILVGRDVNPLESQSIFNTLLRLADALDGDVDLIEARRVSQLLEIDLSRALDAVADLSTRERTLESLSIQLEDQTLQLRTNLSEEIDVDFVEAASNLSAAQLAFQASLQTAGRMLQLSLLDFI